MPGIREFLETATPQLVADLTLYATNEGGKKLAAQPGYGCPCLVSKAQPLVGYDGWPMLTTLHRISFYCSPVAAPLPAADELYFETMRSAIERLFAWDDTHREESFARWFKPDEVSFITADGADVG